MILRKGKTKTLLESSIDSALLAVEVYNKPRTAFRSEGFITLMIIAWTRLFHAHFNHTIGEKYFYKNKNGRFEIVDGEKKSWELSTCIKKYNQLNEPIRKNLEFFIKLRNKIEHRNISKREIDATIFGECQSLLYNYENTLIYLFGKEYGLNESLVYSLQFSHLRSKQQSLASKSALSKDLSDLIGFIDKYRNNLTESTFNSQEYSIKLVQIPKISSTSRSDYAVEFVKWDELNEDDKDAYEKLSVLIKDKKVKIEAANVGRLKPSDVVKKVNESLPFANFNTNQHAELYKIFGVRPNKDATDPFDTISDFCVYDEPHNDYVYQDAWVTFIVHFLELKKYSPKEIREMLKNNEKLSTDDYRL
jgi:hypothetical protein